MSPEVRSSASIRMHALKVHFYGRFTCAICTFRGDFARELMDHMAQDHKEVSTAKCPICDQESSLENIENHYRNCVKIKLTKSVTDDKCEQVCPTCGKILKTRDELYKNRSSRKTDSLLANRSSGSPILLKIVSENLIFREDLCLYNCLQKACPTSTSSSSCSLCKTRGASGTRSTGAAAGAAGAQGSNSIMGSPLGGEFNNLVARYNHKIYLTTW